MAGKFKQSTRGTGRRGTVGITGQIVVGAAGAVAAGTVCELATITKNAAAGRYDLVFDRVYKGTPRLIGSSLTRPNTTSFGNTNANACQGQLGATNGTFTLQGILSSTGVDTDFVSGMIVSFEIEVAEL